MSRNILIRAMLSLAAAAVGCSPSAPPPQAVIEPAMVFPMIVVWPGQQLVVWRDQAAFKRMHTNILHNTSLGDPVLIDGTGGMFDVREMNSTKSGGWHMLHPVAMSPIDFKLTKREPSGIAAARELVAGCEYFLGSSDDAPQVRARIAAAPDVPGIVEALIADLSTTSPTDTPPQP